MLYGLGELEVECSLAALINIHAIGWEKKKIKICFISEVFGGPVVKDMPGHSF